MKNSHPSYLKLETKLKADIKKNGFVQNDKRYQRTVYALPGHFIVIKEKKLLDYLVAQEIPDKYFNDSDRMGPSLRRAVFEAGNDLNSRQLMVFNDKDFDKVHQCFTSMQFVYTERKEFDLYVYQRSSDIEKLHDDLVFFSFVAKFFSEIVGKKVTKIVVIYGNCHYTKE